MIPKILHQIWIGKHPPPLSLMATWKHKHPDFEYILWNEEEIRKRDLTFKCFLQISNMIEINGKADIMRWEILYKYGGYFVDADSICIESFDDYFEGVTAFATFENENIRTKLIATGTMGFIPQHELCKDIIDWISSNKSSDMISKVNAWGSVGPGLLTTFLQTNKYKEFYVFPSNCFLPIHFSGLEYTGHRKVYAHQLWASHYKKYDNWDSVSLPPQLITPDLWVSVLISSFNTCDEYIKECLQSIKNQIGYFGIEVVWINDGSDDFFTELLKKELDLFVKRTRFCKLNYIKMDKQCGLSYCLHRGVELCENEIIFRMDSDDIMLPERFHTQLDFLKNNPDCLMCGTNMKFFKNENNKKKILGITKHDEILTWETFLEKRPKWFMNHPTLCFYKKAILDIGNYPLHVKENFILEDYDLEVRFLKKYGKIYNLPDPLLLYRIHNQQLTCKYDAESVNNNIIRNQIVDKVLQS